MGGFTQSALLKALGWSLFDSLWQMALLWGCYMLLVAALSKMTSHNRHGLAVLLTALGTGSFVLSFITHYYIADGPAMNAWLSPLFLTAEYTGYALPSLAGSIDRLLPCCSSLYLFTLTWLFARYWRHYLHSRRIKKERFSKIGPGLRVFVAQTASRLGIKKEVGVWISSMVDVPVTLGFLRPVILIPFAMVNHLSLEQAEAVLLHELAHIQRNDYLLNLGVTITELLFFFNPFARMLIKTIKREREHRCDDLVMQFRYDPHVYASALLSLATMGQHRQALALAATGKNDRLLLQRVKRILKQDTDPHRPAPGSLVFVLFTVLTALCILPRSHSADLLADRVPATGLTINRPIPPMPGRSALKWNSPERFSSPQPLAKVFSSTENKQILITADPKTTAAPKISHSRSNDEGDQLSDQVISIAGNRPPDDEMGHSADQAPTVFNISLTFPKRQDSSEARRFFAELTDAKSSASQVKAKIAKAIAANEASLAKARQTVNSSVRAIRDLPPDGQSGQRSQRLFLEEQLHWQRQELRTQQDLKRILERAAKRLTIVYI